MVKANVPNASLLPVIIFMVVISCFRRWAAGAFWTNKSFDKINHATRSENLRVHGIVRSHGLPASLPSTLLETEVVLHRMVRCSQAIDLCNRPWKGDLTAHIFCMRKVRHSLPLGPMDNDAELR
jgi:hypothetical protein